MALETTLVRSLASSRSQTLFENASRLLPILLLATLGGCNLPDKNIWSGQEKHETGLVPGNPFGAPPLGPASPGPLPRASQDVAWRVDCLGRKILAANPEVGLKSYFVAYGSTQPEIFHRGTQTVYVSEGLVKECKSQADLAAVLCHELGKMVAQREALASPKTRRGESLPPLVMPIGNSANIGDLPQVREAELGKYERENPKVRGEIPSPHPEVLARLYLEKAGFQKTDLDAVLPLLEHAERLRQLKTSPQAEWR